MTKPIKLHDSTKSNLDALEMDGLLIKSYDQKIAYLHWFHETHIQQLDRGAIILDYYRYLRNQK